jgi:hypothetical protein
VSRITIESPISGGRRTPELQTTLALLELETSGTFPGAACSKFKTRIEAGTGRVDRPTPIGTLSGSDLAGGPEGWGHLVGEIVRPPQFNP